MFRAPARVAAAAAVQAREPGRGEGKLGGDPELPGRDRADPATRRRWHDPRAPGESGPRGERKLFH